MNNTWIKTALLAVMVIMAIVVFLEYRSSRPGKGPANPFQYSVDEYKDVDPDLITYRETKQIGLSDVKPVDLAWHKGFGYLLTSEALKKIDPQGRESFSQALPGEPSCITIGQDGVIYVALGNMVISYDSNGQETARTEMYDAPAHFSSLAASGNTLFVADAGSKQVRVLSAVDLTQTGSFRGESGVSDQHGFILPSAHFDMAVNAEQELWIVNPGLHAIQNYSHDGRLRGYWRKPSFGLEGFSGCCNPSYIAFLSDGKLLTSEKGLVRIKIHNISGAFEEVVAPPSSFKKDGLKAPAIAVDDQDNIVALDYDMMMLRFFEKKPNAQ